MANSSSGNDKRILVGCTGSVATIKLPQLLKAILETKYSVPWNVQLQVILTERARHFCASADLPVNVPVYYDENEWSAWSKRGDPVLHIELAKWADIFVISPLDENTLAKLAQVLTYIELYTC
jgi:phosphopantothenoylcysteine decarboxylase